MAGTITHQDKFHRVFSNVSSTGVLSDGCGSAFKVLEETTLRVSTYGFIGGNILVVKGRLLDDLAWTTVDTISASESKVIPIHTGESGILRKVLRLAKIRANNILKTQHS